MGLIVRTLSVNSIQNNFRNFLSFFSKIFSNMPWYSKIIIMQITISIIRTLKMFRIFWANVNIIFFRTEKSKMSRLSVKNKKTKIKCKKVSEAFQKNWVYTRHDFFSSLISLKLCRLITISLAFIRFIHPK